MESSLFVFPQAIPTNCKYCNVQYLSISKCRQHEPICTIKLEQKKRAQELKELERISKKSVKRERVPTYFCNYCAEGFTSRSVMSQHRTACRQKAPITKYEGPIRIVERTPWKNIVEIG
jgi:hypothetical protein